jgi:hypothetical protein
VRAGRLEPDTGDRGVAGQRHGQCEDRVHDDRPQQGRQFLPGDAVQHDRAEVPGRLVVGAEVAAEQQRPHLGRRLPAGAEPGGQIGNPGRLRVIDLAPVEVDDAVRVAVDLQHPGSTLNGQTFQYRNDPRSGRSSDLAVALATTGPVTPAARKKRHGNHAVRIFVGVLNYESA